MVYRFSLMRHNYIATGTVASVLQTLDKRISNLLETEIHDKTKGYVRNAMLFKSLMSEYIERVREGISAGLIVEEKPNWNELYASESMIIKRKAA